MQHYRFVIDALIASGRRLPTAGGDLMVAQRSNSGTIDWELIHKTSEIVTLVQAPYQLQMNGPEGKLSGPAVLVRSDGRSHVFRGAGELDGFGGFERWLPASYT